MDTLPNDPPQVAPACAWDKSGAEVVETRPAWAEEYPDGACEPVLQTRACTCGEESTCSEFAPPASATCTNGCGSHPHGTVLWSEERVRYASAKSLECEPQRQGRGDRCVGSYGGKGNGTFVPSSTWCVEDGAFCSGTVPLFLYRICLIVVLSPLPMPPSPPPTPHLALPPPPLMTPVLAPPSTPAPMLTSRDTTEARSDHISVQEGLIVSFIVGGAFLAAATIVVVVYMAWEIKERTRQSRS